MVEVDTRIPSASSKSSQCSARARSGLARAWAGSAASKAAPSGGWGCHSKKSLPAAERDEAERRRWREGVGRLGPRRLVFVDECGTHTSMTRLRARAPRGERAYGAVPRNRGKNTTLIASMPHEGMGPCMSVLGSTTKAVFEAYVERVLAPSLSPGQVVVLDNLGAHKGERVREFIEVVGCELLFLPPYSLGFSPI